MEKRYKRNVPLTELQLWDCFSYDICITEKQMLSVIKSNTCRQVKKWYHGWYMFTIDNANVTNLERNVTYAETPSQHKSFNILKLENAILPLNLTIELSSTISLIHLPIKISRL